jgi:hypothetical protein
LLGCMISSIQFSFKLHSVLHSHELWFIEFWGNDAVRSGLWILRTKSGGQKMQQKPSGFLQEACLSRICIYLPFISII